MLWLHGITRIMVKNIVRHGITNKLGGGGGGGGHSKNFDRGVQPRFLQPYTWLRRPRAKIKMGQNQTIDNRKYHKISHF